MDQFPFSSLPTSPKELQSVADSPRLQSVLFQQSPLPMMTFNAEGTITSFNMAAEAMLHYTAEEVVGIKNLKHFVAPSEPVHESVKEMTERISAQGKPERHECKFVNRNGEIFPVAISLSSLLEDSQVVGYSLIATTALEQSAHRREIEESEAQLKALVSSIDDIVFELDQQGRFQKMWVKSDDFLFMPRNEILGRTLSEMLGDEFAAPFNEGFRQVVETGEPFNWEYKAPFPGDDRWFVAKAAAIFDHGTRTNRISLCIQNITEQKKMELSIRDSEEKFRLLAENIPGVVYLKKVDDTIVYLNEEISNLAGYTPDDFLSGKMKLSDLIHEEDKTYVKNIRAKSLEDRIEFQLEYRIRHASGTWRWVAETGTGVYSAGEPIFLEGCITDISPRKESEEVLRRMADENSRIFNNTLTMGALASFDGYFRKINPAWGKTLGWTREELISSPFHSFIHGEDATKTTEVFELICGGNTVPTFENRFRCKDGSYRWLLWSCSPDIARKLIYISAIDITSRKKSEEELLISKRNLEVAAYELEEQNRQLDEFAHIISHNLRAPVNNIKALLNFINDNSGMSDYQLIFEKIRNVTFNISETMNELLETIRIKKNHEIERVEIRFKDILDKVVQSLEGELIESGATITYNFNNAPKIYYSKTYLESILQNLLSNAIKYRSPDRIPEIFVSTDLVKNGIEMRVKDNGLGIDMQLFGNKLFGLHKTFHENKEARGVGLFLTKTQIETLGGTITAESEVNKGTTFVIQF